METTELNEVAAQPAPTQLLVTQTAQQYLLQIAKWTKFLSIMGFIGSGLMVLAGISFGTIMTVASKFQPAGSPFPSAFGGLFGFLYILIGVFYFFISLKLYQFGDRAKIGVQFNDPLQLESGIGKLKSLFKMVGIATIVLLVLYALILIGVIIAAVIGASMLKPGY